MKKSKPAKAAKKTAAKSRPALSAAPEVARAGPPVSDSITVNPADFSRSMQDVLDVVKFRNANARNLIGFSISPSTVLLLFQPV